MNIYTVKFIYS